MWLSHFCSQLRTFHSTKIQANIWKTLNTPGLCLSSTTAWLSSFTTLICGTNISGTLWGWLVSRLECWEWGYREEAHSGSSKWLYNQTINLYSRSYGANSHICSGGTEQNIRNLQESSTVRSTWTGGELCSVQQIVHRKKHWRKKESWKSDHKTAKWPVRTEGFHVETFLQLWPFVCINNRPVLLCLGVWHITVSYAVLLSCGKIRGNVTLWILCPMSSHFSQFSWARPSW